MGSVRRFHSLAEIADKEKEGTAKMSFSIMKRNPALAVAGRGKAAATEAVIAVADNGQIVLNSFASKALEGKYGLIVFDASTRTLGIAMLNTLPKGMTEDETYKIGEGKKSKQKFVSGSQVLKEVGYDYVASGRQTFKGKMSTEKGIGQVVSFVVPEGSLTKKEVKPRKKKVSAIAPTPVESNDQDSLKALQIN